jgi:nucleotide-binding universal stress UspA family protein
MLAITNILVATDFSECSDAAWTYGRALAHKFGAHLHLLHVAESLIGDGFNVTGYVASIPELQAELEDAECRRLEGLVSDQDRCTLHVTTVLRTLDAPAHAIVQYAKDERIDVIVVGTHGRRGLVHLVMGSVAETVVRTAPCPVLTVRHPEREFVVSDAGDYAVAGHGAPHLPSGRPERS